MPRYLVLLLMVFALACKNKTAEETVKNQPVTTSGFFDAFKKLQLPYVMADTSMKKITDTTNVSYDVLKQFVPDSALQTLDTKKPESLRIHPIGKIENESEIYLLVTVTDGKKVSLITYLFDKNKHYLNHLVLLNNQSYDKYVHSVNINTEPTFLLVREKTENNQYSYTKNGYAFSKEAKGFVIVINDNNEDKKSTEVLNPIDTLPNKNKYSGDYVEDKKNFISLRDGKNESSYLFFIHFEKKSGDCIGELKGTMTMVGEHAAVFQQNGDPCVIDFTFEDNRIKVKERGSCGNHRGMTCMFDDSYKKKKEPAAATKKGKKK